MSNQVSYQPADLFNLVAPVYVSRAATAYIFYARIRANASRIHFHSSSCRYRFFSFLTIDPLSISQDNSNLSRRLCAILAVRFACRLCFFLSQRYYTFRDLNRNAVMTSMKNVIYRGFSSQSVLLLQHMIITKTFSSFNCNIFWRLILCIKIIKKRWVYYILCKNKEEIIYSCKILL